MSEVVVEPLQFTLIVQPQPFVTIVAASGGGGGGAGTIAEVVASGTGLDVTDGVGPIVQIALDFGAGAGQVADGGDLADAIADVATNTADIATNAADIAAHAGNTSNPHSVTKAQVGLSNVTNDVQLKNAANELSSLTQKSTPTISDLLLIQDQAASGALKYVTIGSMPPPSGIGVYDPVMDAPTSGNADDQEFATDVLASGAWKIYADAIPVTTAFTRSGTIDLMAAAPSAGTFRSAVVGGRLLLQVPNNTAVVVCPASPYSTTTGNQMWWASMHSRSDVLGSSNSNNPFVGFFLAKDLGGGKPDWGNRLSVALSTNTNKVRVANRIFGAANLLSDDALTDAHLRQGSLGGVGLIAVPTSGTYLASPFLFTDQGAQIFTSSHALNSLLNTCFSAGYYGFYLQSNPLTNSQFNLFVLNFVRHIDNMTAGHSLFHT